MDEEELLRQAYAAFNARDVDAVLALMHPDVDWPNAMEGRREHGHAAVREYWTRQFGLIDPQVEPTGFSRDDEGRVVVEVREFVRDMDGEQISEQDVRHVYTLRDGLITRMDIREG
jgi:ketosteroid isomerase-like protein